jgi:hypothetical protein
MRPEIGESVDGENNFEEFPRTGRFRSNLRPHHLPTSFLSARFHFLPGIILLLFQSASTQAAPLLEHDVLPYLTKNCMGCHGGLKKKVGSI